MKITLTPLAGISKQPQHTALPITASLHAQAGNPVNKSTYPRCIHPPLTWIRIFPLVPGCRGRISAPHEVSGSRGERMMPSLSLRRGKRGNQWLTSQRQGLGEEEWLRCLSKDGECRMFMVIRCFKRGMNRASGNASFCFVKEANGD